MKIKLAAFLFAAVFLILPKLANAESINDFASKIVINSDSSINIQETIVYDFGTVPHHGIFRDIPYHYEARGGNYNLRINIDGVFDSAGNPYKYTTGKTNGQVQIKIGDPNLTVVGLQTYVIKYSVKGAINYFNDHDELYWNVTGNGWQVPIANTSAIVTGPASVSLVGCFSGSLGSVSPCQQSAIKDGAGEFKHSNLAPGEGLTAVVSFPKGFIHKPTAWEHFQQIIADNWILGLPILTLILMWMLWRKRGKDPLGFSTIIPQYEAPEGLTPIEVGTIIDESADNQDVSAEIIYLATKGYLKITRLEEKILIFNKTDYRLDKLKEAADLPDEFDRSLMESIFGGISSIKLSGLKNKFYNDLAKIKKLVYSTVVTKGYFAKNPSSIRSLYGSLGVIVFFVGLAFIKNGLYAAAAVIVSGIIIGVFGKFMPAKTIKGAQARQYILGLKMYLSVAEKDRLKFFNAPDKSPDRFEKLLPYAMVLGVEEQWAKQFEGIYNGQPSWYSDPTSHTFNSLFLINSLHNFSASANTNLASRPSSAGSGGSGFGGGGFSGGGFGGGGGGSW